MDTASEKRYNPLNDSQKKNIASPVLFSGERLANSEINSAIHKGSTDVNNDIGARGREREQNSTRLYSLGCKRVNNFIKQIIVSQERRQS